MSYTPRHRICLGVVGSFSSTLRDEICLLFGAWGVSQTSPILQTVWSIVGWGVSLTRPVLKSVCSVGRRIVSIKRLVINFVWSFVGWGVSLTRSVLELISSFGGWGVSLTRPVLVGVSSKFLLHTQRWNQCVRSADRGSLLTPRARIGLVVRRVGSFYYTPRA